MMVNSSDHSPYPLTFEPVLKDYIWGGRNLETHLGRELPSDVDIAESWEIAAHENGDVTVNNGPLSGRTLSGLCREMGADLIGSAGAWAQERGKFPLLIKLLDANRKLSVQVHPGDRYAQKHEGNELGKTEMWVVLHAEEDASIILGVKEGTTPENFRSAVRDGALEPLLHEINVRSGDFICVPSGSLHAILGGLIIAEIQQNSDVTYRVYDWNRVGHDGSPRPLHVDKAQDVINFYQVEPPLPSARLLAKANGLRRWELCRNHYFVVERVEMAEGVVFDGQCSGRSLEIWGTVKGEAVVTGGGRQVFLSGVQFVLLPASMGEFEMKAASRSMLLRTTLQ